MVWALGICLDGLIMRACCRYKLRLSQHDLAPGAPYVLLRVPWDGLDELMSRDGYRKEWWLLQHNVNNKELCLGKCSCFRVYWVLSGLL